MTDRRLTTSFAGVTAAIAAFSGAFLVMGLVRLPTLWYHPLTREWLVESKPNGLGMDFYGRVLAATTLACVAYLAVSRGARDSSPTREQLWLWLSYGLVLFALATALVGYQIWPRPPQPIPIPAWYHPQ
ncbi:MAG: hypothetical protein ACYCWW_09435 [Deltaproteobacteria bacterium]